MGPGFYYHTSGKEPVASVKNIDFSESPKTAAAKRYKPGEKVIIPSVERTTKAGTAWPSTRHGVGSP